MNIQDMLEQYRELDEKISAQRDFIRKYEAEKNGLREKITSQMEANGIRRIMSKDETYEARVNVRKGLRVTDKTSAVMSVQRLGVDPTAYMDVSMPKLNVTVKRLIKDVKDVNGVEESEQRYISLVDLKKDKC